MTIALLVPAMDLGGVEQGAFDLARGFVGRGHRVIVVSGPGRYLPRLQAIGVTWHRLPLDRKNPCDYLRSVARLRQIQAREKPDIVHARSRLPAWAAWHARTAWPAGRLVTSVHGFHHHRLYSRILGRGERVIAVSGALAAYAVECLGAPREKVRVVHNGLDLSAFENLDKVPAPGKNARETVVGAIGRMTETRGYECLLEAIRLLGRGPGDFKLLLVGSGPRENKLKKLAARLGIADRVVFTRGRQVDFLGRIDIMAVPFNRPEERRPGEIFWPGRTGAEAQAAGIPVITTAGGPAPGRFEPGADSLFVPPGDAAAFAAGIRFLADHPAERDAFARRGRETARRYFSLEAMVENTLAVYREALGRPGPD